MIFVNWLLHWATAGLVLAVLLTSLPLEVLRSVQSAGLSWTRTHIIIGVTILAVTVARLAWRLVNMRRAAAGRRQVRSRAAWGLQWSLLILLLVISVTGLLAFQPSPLAPPVKLLGFSIASPFRLDHNAHMMFVSLHRWLAIGFPVLLALHIAQAFKREAPSGRTLIWRMAWPWMPRG